MGKGGKKSVVGYKYRITMHVALCHGEIDAIRSLWWADKKAWEGYIGKTSDGTSEVFWETNKGLFGGESSEGGVDGLVEVGFGSHQQKMLGILPNGTYDAAFMPTLGGRIGTYWKPSWPEMACQYRGLAVLFLHGNYIGNNAYMKDLSAEVERFWRGWFPEVSQIGKDANPAHIIYESAINRDWGLGYGTDILDEDSFRVAAQRLYDEGLGLSFIWDSEDNLQSFIDDIKSCIDASFYLHRRTGKWVLKLNRPGDPIKMTIGPENAELESYTRKSLGETFNEISVKYTSRETEDYVSVTVQDAANIESQGRVLPTTKEYIGVREEAVAIALGQRDMQVSSATLATAEVIVNRTASDLYPGDVVNFTWPEDEINNLQMRIVEVTIKAPGDERISLKLVEDVFGQANGSFNGISPPGWVDPAKQATLFDITQTWEIPFWYVAQGSGVSIDALPSMAGYGTTLAVGGNTDARFVRLYGYQSTPDGLAWELEAIGMQTPTAMIADVLPKEITSVIGLQPDSKQLTESAEVNSFILITDGNRQEIAQVTATSSDGNTLTLQRGLMDSHPWQWPTGTRIFYIGQSTFVPDYVQRSFGEVVQYRPAMQTSISQMDVTNVPSRSLQIRGRYELPYSVANVYINGARWPSTVTAEGIDFPVTWSSRNRLLQDAAQQVPWDAGSIAPEDGTTYTVQLRNSSNVNVASATGLTTTSWDIPTGNLVSGTHTLFITALRNGRGNYINYEHTFTLDIPARETGYGMSYGFDYGE